MSMKSHTKSEKGTLFGAPFRFFVFIFSKSFPRYSAVALWICFYIQSPLWGSGKCTPYNAYSPRPKRACRCAVLYCLTGSFSHIARRKRTRPLHKSPLPKQTTCKKPYWPRRCTSDQMLRFFVRGNPHACEWFRRLFWAPTPHLQWFFVPLPFRGRKTLRYSFRA